MNDDFFTKEQMGDGTTQNEVSIATNALKASKEITGNRINVTISSPDKNKVSDIKVMKLAAILSKKDLEGLKVVKIKNYYSVAFEVSRETCSFEEAIKVLNCLSGDSKPIIFIDKLMCIHCVLK